MNKYALHPFTEEQKQLAASVDLVEFLRQRGEKLLPSGHEKRLDSDHSITVRGNEWYDHAAEKGGGPISFAQTFYHLSYPDAVTLLLGGLAAGACSSTEKQTEVEKAVRTAACQPHHAPCLCLSA